ncbi:MAG: inorganic phosphate transporter [Bacteroidetes bacterium]|nr:inorganic phosphate transporter [Bacteroidota bacterium]
MLLLYLAAGLYLGWTLGGNDAANIFGSAVGSRMLRFRDAALVGSIFVVLGAVFQGRGGAQTLNELGRIDSMAAAFIISLSAALVVHYMTNRGLPVSTSQAIVGGILGWVFFNRLSPDLSVITKIVFSWVSGPLLGMLFAALLYKTMKKILLSAHIHVIKLDTWIRFGLVVSGAFGAYSLGANNIANVMGVFVPMAPHVLLDFGLFTLDGVQVLFLLGGLAIAAGIYTLSRKVMETVGNGLLALNAEAAIVVVISQALVMFLFSSSTLAQAMQSVGLPSFPLVPVSSTQLVVGSIVGIGLVKGNQDVNAKLLAGIGAGWIITPLAAGLISYILLFIAMNVFDLPVRQIPADSIESMKHSRIAQQNTIDLILPAIVAVSGILIALFAMLYYRTRQKQLQTENELLQQQNLNLEAKKALDELKLKLMHASNEALSQKVSELNREFTNLATGLTAQKIFLEELSLLIEQLRQHPLDQEVQHNVQKIQTLVQQKMSFTKAADMLYLNAEQTNRDFVERLEKNFPDLSPQEKRLALLIRVGMSNKEIATMLNIAPKSVEVFKYRLKKRLGIAAEQSVNDFIMNL